MDRINAWFTVQPFIALMMIIAACVLFALSYKQKKAEKECTSFWQWLQIVIESGLKALLFLGLLWAFRAILNSNLVTFRQSHGRVSEVNYNSVLNIWGGGHIQKELSVSHYITKTIKEEIPREDITKPPVYRETEIQEQVDQNSILSSAIEVKLTLTKRQKGSAFYSGFESFFKSTYEVINDSEYTTEAEFYFPLSFSQTMYEDMLIYDNEQEVKENLRVSPSNLYWKKTMQPHEKSIINVSYKTRGLETFYYQIPVPRQINNFLLTLEIDKLPVTDINYPEGCLTPMEITEINNGEGTMVQWTLDHSITTAGMGVALPTPKQPGEEVALVLNNSPYALMFLVVTICLTLLLLGKTINFIEISLLSAIYCLVFYVMASLSDFLLGFWGSLVIGSLLTLGLTFLLYRKYPSTLLKYLIYSLVLFFTLIYPLTGLLPDFQDAWNGIVSILIIIYIFFIALYSRTGMKSVE
ncbi:MAG: hypothetical protein JXB88_01930 [Spirochaetales bacterium]|nr:hypothetical protein [Spirochaetales bacterium]